jgi:cytochrome c oxidase subunit 2
MQERTGNPNFAYEISCDQMCGNGHYSMKGIIQVVTQAEYDVWVAKQKPYYFSAFPDKDPATIKPVADSSKKVTATVDLIKTQKSSSKI